MWSRRKKNVCRPSRIKNQRGAAVLIMLTILVLGAASILIGQLNKINFRQQNDQQTDQALLEAKSALIGWSLSYAQRPGLLPVPDLRGDNNYDGDSDCPFGAINNTHLLGRLPWRVYLNAPPDAYCSSDRGGLGSQIVDADGEMLWYSVSENLLYDSAYPTINSDIKNLSSGWITIRDDQGIVISDRVAAVVLAAGDPLPGQNRAAAAPTANNYLDSITVGTTTYSNADFDSDFLIAGESDSFNDRLEYITIDQLVAQVERKVIATARSCLDAYAVLSADKYPWASPLDGSAPPAYTGIYGERFGRIPDTLSIESSPSVNDTTMQTTWQPANCFSGLSYWSDWRESIFYQVASGYEPGGSASCATCLTVDGSGTYPVVLVLAGSELSGQSRSSNSDKGAIGNYLEAGNVDGDNAFENQAITTSFNDRAICVDGGDQCR